MGEIYRSVSVTGIRRLETERAARVHNEKREKGREKTAAAKTRGEPDTPQGDQPAAPAPEQPAAPGSASPQAEMEQDLLASLQRRLAQLEEQSAAQETQLEQLTGQRDRLLKELELSEKQQQAQGYRDGLEQAKAEVAAEQEAWRAEYDKLRTLFSNSLESQLEHVNRYAVDIAFASLARIIGEP